MGLARLATLEIGSHEYQHGTQNDGDQYLDYVLYVHAQKEGEGEYASQAGKPVHHHMGFNRSPFDCPPDYPAYEYQRQYYTNGD